MYNKKIKVIDCTIRDGGLINKWQFSDETVKDVLFSVRDAGIDYMEIGYRASEKMFSPGEFGAWRFTKDEKLREIIGDEDLKDLKLGVMVDIGRVEAEDFAPVDESPLSFVRVATYLKDIDKAIKLANIIAEKGYETFINIMAISTVNDHDLAKGLQQVEEETSVTAVSVVDSNGALYPLDTKALVEIYKTNLKTKDIGIHAHNNQQLGFANTITAIGDGIGFADATIQGIGRGAGNCPLELLIGWLKNPKYDIEPILDRIQTTFVELEKKIEWGALPAYMVTGILNEHPRTAIALRASDEKNNVADFYKQLTTPECFN